MIVHILPAQGSVYLKLTESLQLMNSQLHHKRVTKPINTTRIKTYKLYSQNQKL